MTLEWEGNTDCVHTQYQITLIYKKALINLVDIVAPIFSLVAT